MRAGSIKQRKISSRSAITDPSGHIAISSVGVSGVRYASCRTAREVLAALIGEATNQSNPAVGMPTGRSGVEGSRPGLRGSRRWSRCANRGRALLRVGRSLRLGRRRLWLDAARRVRARGSGQGGFERPVVHRRVPRRVVALVRVPQIAPAGWSERRRSAPMARLLGRIGLRCWLPAGRVPVTRAARIGGRAPGVNLAFRRFRRSRVGGVVKSSV
jgi:hypothetical protein